jgi:NMD protein affecting ribosome stability and mRNA decay
VVLTEKVMSKGLIRSLDRRGTRSDMSPPVARKQTFRDPSVCDRCGAIYSAKVWRRGRRLDHVLMDKAAWVICPGCAQAASGEYHGRVLIDAADDANRDSISARIANVERRAQTTQPERRIVSSEWNKNTLEVFTTSQKLAHRIAREIEKAFHAKARFSWSDDDGTLFARVTCARSAARKPKR